MLVFLEVFGVVCDPEDRLGAAAGRAFVHGEQSAPRPLRLLWEKAAAQMRCC